MALLHKATLTPSKLELLEAWLPRQSWSTDEELTQFGSYRLDDPDGEVGLEGILMRTEDHSRVLQVPLTYRAEPLEGAEEHLVGTTEHSVLGTRYVYDGMSDPLFLTTFATVALTAATGAEEYFEIDGEKVVREPSVRVKGTGAPAGAYGTNTPAKVTVQREVGPMPDHQAGDAIVIGSWDGDNGVLGFVRLSERR